MSLWISLERNLLGCPAHGVLYFALSRQLVARPLREELCCVHLVFVHSG